MAWKTPAVSGSLLPAEIDAILDSCINGLARIPGVAPNVRLAQVELLHFTLKMAMKLPVEMMTVQIKGVSDVCKYSSRDTSTFRQLSWQYQAGASSIHSSAS